jgi:hypothetical protein
MKNVASFSQSCKQENEARYIGEKYFNEVSQTYQTASVRQLNGQ